MASGRETATDEAISRIRRWRETATDSNQRILDFYAKWRNGICSGMGWVSVREIQAVLTLEGVPETEHAEIAERVMAAHGLISALESEKNAT